MSSLKRSAYWRSLDELADTPEFQAFVAKEFPVLTAELGPEVVNGETRRTFLKLMAASMALAGLTGCRWPRDHIYEFAHRPEGFVPGAAVQYATAIEAGGAATGLVVTSVDGRPIKIEGNPLHPSSLGATTPWMQAAVLELYDPERSRAPLQREAGREFERTWDEFETAFAALADRARAAGGRGFRVLSRASSSPTLAALRARFAAAFPGAVWHEYEPLSRDAEREGTALAFGRPLRPHPRLAQADVILALDDDFLSDHPAAVRLAREYASRRRAEDGTLSRLYVLESAHTITGAKADERYAIAARQIPAIAAAIAAALRESGVPLPPFAGAGTPEAGEADLARRIAADLAAHRGRSLVTAGAGQPAEVHALAHLCNVALGNVGRTVEYFPDPDGDRPPHLAQVARLAEDMRAGRVEALLVLGGNPVYDAPADLDFAGALGKVGVAVHCGLYRDETARLCAWHVPAAHFLESWSDARAWDGTVSVVQPLIAPLYDGRTEAELVALLLGERERSDHALVRGTFGGGDDAWRTALNRGVVEGSAFTAIEPQPDAARIGPALAALATAGAPLAEGAVELRFLRDSKVLDGRFANNAWLQELPDPITTIVWDNALYVNPVLAAEAGLALGQLVRLNAGGRDLEVPVVPLPGMPPRTVAIALGYGREAAGAVAAGSGFDAYRLRTTAAPHVTTATLQRGMRRYPLSLTQNHWALETLGRREVHDRAGELVRAGTLAEFKANPNFAQHDQHEFWSLWKEFEYKGHAWGMAIDLSTCIGCGSCVVACQAENNIPVVGKEQVARGREMHWIRVDRYFKGDPATAEVAFQPMACVHCETAPCEQVCPVGATLHGDEGINQMVYNRCIGTRYCSNNCPYKVRRFNYFNWHEKVTPLRAMQHNPEVTVRGRGVMEKCTYCIQRIEAARDRAKQERRPIRDGDIVTACAQACPTEAIVFGDLNDPESRVRRLHGSPRAYALLAELNTRPRTHYLARLTNPITPRPGHEETGEQHGM